MKEKLTKIDLELKKILRETEKNMRKKKLNDELQDIVNLINKFSSLQNKDNLVMVGGIVVFDDRGEVDSKKNVLFAFGNKENIRLTLNELRDRIEDNADEEDFVDF